MISVVPRRLVADAPMLRRAGTQRAEAAATYYRSNGYEITADELTALEIARKQATGEPLSEHELETVAGGFIADIFADIIKNLGEAFLPPR